MKLNKAIDTYADTYAVVKIYGDGQYGHMEAFIYNLAKTYGVRPDIRVSCQIGGHGADQRRSTYALSRGMSNNYSITSITEMESMLKVMRKIARKLEQIEEELGRAETFAEYMARVLIAAKPSAVFINEKWGGGYWSLDALPRYSPTDRIDTGAMRSCLRSLEKNLIALYNPKTVE